MIIVHHRINTIDELSKVPNHHGVEIDVRGFGQKLVLNHEPLVDGDELAEYLKHFYHRFIIFNIKEAGIEDRVHALAAQHNVRDYFLLDVEFPYIYRAARAGERRIALRYSEDECIDTVMKYKGMVDWVWIDTNTKLPLNETVVEQLHGLKTALVCPERWGRPQDIRVYIEKMKSLDFHPDLVMASRSFVEFYERSDL